MTLKTLQEHLRITMAFRQENTGKARIRYENFKSKTTVYQKEFLCFCSAAFVLPTLVSGAIIIYSSYSKTTKEVDRHLDNTLNLVVDNLNDLDRYEQKSQCLY